MSRQLHNILSSQFHNWSLLRQTTIYKIEYLHLNKRNILITKALSITHRQISLTPWIVCNVIQKLLGIIKWSTRFSHLVPRATSITVICVHNYICNRYSKSKKAQQNPSYFTCLALRYPCLTVAKHYYSLTLFIGNGPVTDNQYYRSHDPIAF